MGASIMILPSISFLKAQDPNVEIHCLTTRTCLPAWKAIRALDPDKIHVIESGSPFHFIVSAMRTLLKLRSVRFDLIIDYELFMRISAIFSGVLRSRKRAGFYKYNYEGLSRGDFYDFKCAFNQNSHIARNCLALTKTAYQNKDDLPNLKEAIAVEELAIKPVAKSSQSGTSIGNPYFVLCPDVGKTLSVRNYPQKSFAEVIDGLLQKYPEHQMFLIGTAENSDAAASILKQVRFQSRCVNSCGKTSFGELLKLIEGADLLITNDNGPGHFATLTGTKTLALFSTDSPFVYGPLGDAVIAYSYFQCSPCISAFNHKVSSCDNNRCLQAIPPTMVVTLAEKVLAGKVAFRTINGERPYL